jgi:hypothetical protein
LLTILYAVFCAVALWGTWFRRPSSDTAQQRFGVGLVASWIVFPIAITLLVSLIAKPVFFSRFLLMCVPAIALLAAQGLMQFARTFARPKVVLASAAGVMLLLSLSEARRYFQDVPLFGHDWRGVTQYILRHQQPGDAVVISMGLEPFEYYLGREIQPGVPRPDVVFPPELGAGDRSFDASEVLKSACRDHHTVWLVFQATLQATVNSAIPSASQPVDEQIFPGNADGELCVMHLVGR